MKRLTLMVIICLGLLLSWSCQKKGGKYADLYAALEDVNRIAETFNKEIDSISEANQAEAPMRKLTVELNRSIPELEDLLDKYPEVGNAETPLPELKEPVEKIITAFQAMIKRIEKLMQMMHNTQTSGSFKEAQINMLEVVQRLTRVFTRVMKINAGG